MSLRKKTLLAIAMTFSCLILALYIAFRIIVLDNFSDLEKRDAEADTQRVLKNINYYAGHLRASLLDWSVWDDCCAFMDGKMPEFPKLNLDEAGLANLNINLIAFVTPSGKSLLAKAIDPEKKREVALPKGFDEVLRPGSPLLSPRPARTTAFGMMMLPSGPLMLFAAPIVKSSGEGASHGTLIMGRFFDRRQVQKISDLTNLTISMDPFPTSAAPLQGVGNTSITTQIAENSQIAGIVPLNDIYGRPALQLRVSQSRSIYDQGLSLISGFIILVILIGLVFCAITAITVQKLIIDRLSRINDKLRWIGTHADPGAAQIEDTGRDELGALASEINGMLDSLVKSNEALRQSEERLRLGLRGSNVGVWDWDLSSKKVVFVHHWSEILGYNPGEIDDEMEAQRKYVHPEDMPGLSRAIRDHLEGHTPSYEHEYRLRAKSGEWHWFMMRGKVVRRDAEGRALRFVGIHRDVTERHEAQENLIRIADRLESRVSTRTIDLELANVALRREIAERQRAEEALRESSRRKDEFLAMLAHELRNPLAPIRSAVQVLQLSGGNPRTQRRQWDIIDRQVGHMARLLDDLLDVSRITQGKIQLVSEKNDLRRVIDNTLEILQNAINERGHTLLYTRPSAPIWLQGDPTRLEQIFCNLLHNAVKYTESHGTLSISLSDEIGLDALRPMIAVRIKDNGMGVDADVLPHIFDLFVQADRSLDRTQGGLGIGLTLVKRLVQLHGGTVYAASAGLGQGSEFVVRLPVLTESPVGAPEIPIGEQLVLDLPRSEDEAPGETRKILVVDDNVDTATSMGELLEMWSYEVQAVFDGPSAIETALAWQPEIVLLDIGLPGMNGYEVARCLRRAPELAAMMLVALTGYSQDEDRREAQEAGFDAFCTKPFNLEELRDVLENTMSRVNGD